MNKKIYRLYITINKITGYVYGGKHSYKGHIVDDGYIGSGYRLKRAINKYGAENFEVRFLNLKNVNIDNIDRLEIRLIRLLKYFFNEMCYNIHKGGSGGNYYYYLTPEERLEVNQNISKGKKKQHQNGPTVKQKEFYERHSVTIKERIENDPEYKEIVLLSLKKAQKKNHENYLKYGLTEKQKEASRKLAEATQIYRTYDIIYPDGTVRRETKTRTQFTELYKTDCWLFTSIVQLGSFTVKRVWKYTKHPFPLGTKFLLVKE